MNKDYLKRIFHLATPAIIQEALSTIVTYVDTAMVGVLGASASGAVGLTSPVGWFVSNIANAFGIGILALISRYDGAKDVNKLQKVSQLAIFETIVIGIILTFVCIIISPYLPIWLNGDASIIKMASSYFLIVSIPMLFRSAILIFSCTLRGIGDMKSPMYINLIMNLTNIVLNYLLIYDTHKVFGITIYGASLGVNGAAIATAISYTVGGIMIFYIYISNPIFNFKETGFHFNKNIFKECLNISFPVMMERNIICLGHIAFFSLIAKLGVISLASHTIAIQAEQAFYIPGYGFQSVASTLVGNAVGRKDQKEVKTITYTICTITCSLMIIAGLLLYLNAYNLMSIFTNDINVIKLGSKVLRIVSISEPVYGILVILEGTFNGMGDTKAPFLFSCITVWGIRILGSWLVVYVFNKGLELVWIMMVCDNIMRCILLLQRFIRGKWKYLIYKKAKT